MNSKSSQDTIHHGDFTPNGDTSIHLRLPNLKHKENKRDVIHNIDEFKAFISKRKKKYEKWQKQLNNTHI